MWKIISKISSQQVQQLQHNQSRSSQVKKKSFDDTDGIGSTMSAQQINYPSSLPICQLSYSCTTHTCLNISGSTPALTYLGLSKFQLNVNNDCTPALSVTQLMHHAFRCHFTSYHTRGPLLTTNWANVHFRISEAVSSSIWPAECLCPQSLNTEVVHTDVMPHLIHILCASVLLPLLQVLPCKICNNTLKSKLNILNISCPQPVL